MRCRRDDQSTQQVTDRADGHVNVASVGPDGDDLIVVGVNVAGCGERCPISHLTLAGGMRHDLDAKFTAVLLLVE